MTLDTTERKLREDALPEHARYVDTGCELHSACLTCPLPVCKEEVSQGARAIRAHMRGLQVRLLRSEGHTVEWVAQVMGLSIRTVFRLSSDIGKHDASALTDSVRRAKMSIAATPIAESGRGHNGR